MNTFVKSENFYVVQGWMIKELKLKGIEKEIYAIIYGFSQTQDQRFTGSLKYLVDWTGATKPTVINALQALEKKGLVQKFEKLINNVKYCEYIALRPEINNNAPEGSKEILPPSKNPLPPSKETLPEGSKEILPPSKEILPEGSKEILPNNINNNIKDNINKKIKNNDSSVVCLDVIENLEDPECQKVLDSYHSICKNLRPALWQTKKRNSLIKARLESNTIKDIQKAFAIANNSTALNGLNVDRHVTCIEWILDPDNFRSLLSGEYDKAIV